MPRYRQISKAVKDRASYTTQSLYRGSKSVVLWAGDRVLPIVIALTLSGAGIGVYANLDSPAPPSNPSAQSYSMQDLCDRLETGAEGTLETTFAEPPTAPSATPSMCSANDVYELTPQPDEANAAHIRRDVVSGKTFWALTPGDEWGLTTGTGSSATAVLAATGQNTCYNASGSVISCAGTGQDGEYQLGATADPRFTDNGDGTVTDNLTGLIWLQYAGCTALGGNTWENRLNHANNLASGSCGLSDDSVAGDWRMPNRRELLSLVDYQNSSPSLPSGHPFIGTVTGTMWSSTTRVNSPSRAWYVDFSSGLASDRGKIVSTNYWAVR